MAAALGRAVCARCHSFQRALLHMPSPGTSSVLVTQQYAEKHYNLKWRTLRAQKVLKIDLPDFHELKKDAKLSPDELRGKLKKDGTPPPRSHREINITIGSTGSIFEEYVPPEGDGVASLISRKGAKQRVTGLEKKGKSYMQLRKVRQYEDDFDVKRFASESLDMYVEATKLLEDIKSNEDRLHELVTEKGYAEMTWKLEKKTFRWNFLESLEPPRVVHVRTTEMLSKENMYGQVTVRFFTKQTLALYDRFGRLMYGSENLAKDVLEYVVFEKHLADSYGEWRVHSKIIPEWMPARQAVQKTLRKPVFEEIPEDEEEGKDKKTDSQKQGVVATA